MNTNTQEDSWKSRIENTANALGSTTAHVEEKLKSLGYNQDDMGMQMLDDDDVTKFGDFQREFADGPVNPGQPCPVPLAKLRLAFKFLKGSKKSEDRHQIDSRTMQLRELGFKVRIEHASPATLIPLYNGKPNDPVTNALKTRYETKPVIAFNDDDTINAEATLAYVYTLDEGLPESENGTFTHAGKLFELHPVGAQPSRIADEDPLFPGKVLRNQVSGVNNLDWTGVELATRQLCRIIVKRGEADPYKPDTAAALLIAAKDGRLAKVYTAACLEFKKQAKHDNLPKLKVHLGDGKQPNNPFGVSRSY